MLILGLKISILFSHLPCPLVAETEVPLFGVTPDHQNIRALGIFVRVGDLGAGFLLFAFILLSESDCISTCAGSFGHYQADSLEINP